jgi:hypothetical protein
MQSNEESPVLQSVAILIVVVAVGKAIYEKAAEWAQEFAAFCVSIWPVVYATIVTIAVIILLYKLGKLAYARWEAHKKFIFDLKKKIKSLDDIILAKNSEIDRLQRTVSAYKVRNGRLKNGLSRYNRLLVRKISQPGMKPEETNQKVKSALASVLKDFGVSVVNSSKGGLA